MYQIIPLRFLVFAAVWLALGAVIVIDWGGMLAVSRGARAAVVLVDGALFLVTLKPVWRRLWTWFPVLNSWFPDLNGEYDVCLRTNWPVHQRLLDAASKDGPRFDPRLAGVVLPDLSEVKLRASIDLGFYSVNVSMWAEDPTKPGSVIDRSRTFATSLLRPCDGQLHRLVYVYQQKNRRDRQTVTDDSTFEGAAVLDVPLGKAGELKGEYWTNRAWHQGLSTAGTITFTKRGNRESGSEVSRTA